MTEVDDGMDERRFKAERHAGHFFTDIQYFALGGQFYPFQFVGVTFGADDPRGKGRGAAFFTPGGGELFLGKILVKLRNPVEFRASFG